MSIREQCQQMILSDDKLREIMDRLLKDINDGLSREKHNAATVKCFATYIQDLPNGQERGKFLALDLGGTNFRVLLITLDDNNRFDMQSEIYAIAPDIMTGPGVQLFDHIADCLIKFTHKHGIYGEELPLGFTFSFPCKQVGLSKGLLTQWTKGFKCSGVEGNDVVNMLMDALDRRNEHFVKITAIMNDATGTLMNCAYQNLNCHVGIIIGTGCNACYVERTENVENCDSDLSKPNMLVNTEWGNFGADGAIDDILTEFDREIDAHSLNPGKQIFEKIISGMYLGEIVRLMLVKFTKQKLLFNGIGSEKLGERGSFITKYLSDIENDEEYNYNKCREVLKAMDLEHADEQDCVNIRYICEVVSQRAAHLVSAGAATLLNKMDFESVTIGIDGSVYKFHPNFHDLMVEKISRIVKPNIKFDIMLSEDGSGRGAALVAAVASN